LNAINKRAIDLESIDRQLAQAEEVRIPHPEVVYCKRDANPLKFGQYWPGMTLVLHHERLRDLEFQQRRRKTGLAKHRRDECGKSGCANCTFETLTAMTPDSILVMPGFGLSTCRA